MPKTLENVRKTYVVEFLYKKGKQIQSTAHYWAALQIHSGSAQKVFLYVIKSQKFQKNLFQTVPFSLTLQSSSPEFLTSGNADPKKNAFFGYSEIVGSLPLKGLKWSLWLTKRFKKNLFVHFWEDAWKSASMKVLETYQKNVFRSIPFKKFELSSTPNYFYTENWLHRNSFRLFWEFLKLLGDCLCKIVEDWFSKIT